MNLNVYRLDYSAYFSAQFKQKEKQQINNLENYTYEDTDNKLQQVLISTSNTQVNKIEDNQLKNTSLIIHPNSGFDNYDFDFVKNCDAPIICGNIIRAQAVTEYNLSCLFSHYLPTTNQSSWDREAFNSRKLLRDLRIQIIGHGHIGRKISQAIWPICSKIKIYDPFKHKNELFDEIDVLIIACSLNPNNKGFIDKNFLKKMSKQSILINGARGALIKQNDLIDFLSENKNAHAYCDVFEQEPADFEKLSELENMHKTSHLAGCSISLEDDLINFEVNVLKDFAKMSKDDFLEKYKEQVLQNRIHEGILI